MPCAKVTLPIDSLIPQIVDSLRHHPNLVIKAPPGAGKTTRVPAALLDALLTDESFLQLSPISPAAAAATNMVVKNSEPGDYFTHAKLGVEPVEPTPPFVSGPNAKASSHTHNIQACTQGCESVFHKPSRLSQKQAEIWVLEPRRLAAWLAARRVADEYAEPLGKRVGYHVRFEEKSSAETRLRFMTDGVFNRWFLGNPELKEAAIVIVDEVHERSLHADLALALLRHLQLSSRPDIRIIAMSATIDSSGLSSFLGNCPTLQSDGRLFPVEIEYQGQNTQMPLDKQIELALGKVLAKNMPGDILVFLPGAAEIRQASAQCKAIADKLSANICTLHADLPIAERERAVLPSQQRKLILSTNVAESSVTIEGVQIVIDSGLKRSSKVSPWSGLPFSSIERTSKASSIQRSGRAGRTAPGYCIRLYSADDFAMRPEFETPDIASADLSEVLLYLLSLNIKDAFSFPWIEQPPRSHIEAATELLEKLGAIDKDGCLSPIGKAFLPLPVHPRLARIIVEAKKRNILAQGCLTAALLSERDIRRNSRVKLSNSQNAQNSAGSSESDLLDLIEVFASAQQSDFSRDSIRALELDEGPLRRVEKALLRLYANAAGRGSVEIGNLENYTQAEAKKTSGKLSIGQHISQCLLSGFSDRVARCKKLSKTDEVQLELSNGNFATLAKESAVRNAAFVIALEAEERRSTKGLGNITLVRKASAIKSDWLLDLFPERIREVTSVSWNSEMKRVEILDQLYFDKLCFLQSSATEASSSKQEQVQKVLFEAALKESPLSTEQMEAWEKFCAKIDFLQRNFPKLKLPQPCNDDLNNTIFALCQGLKSLNELRSMIESQGIAQAACNLLGEKSETDLRGTLNLYCPDFVNIPRRPKVRVNYEKGKQPWIASRIQDFFGLKQSPTLGKGGIPLVVHLLAPNQRAVQVTDDLAGFWTRHYPEIRQQLCRRYPKHAWPEKP